MEIRVQSPRHLGSVAERGPGQLQRRVSLWRAGALRRARGLRALLHLPPQGAGPARQCKGFPPLDLPKAHPPPSVISDRHAPLGAERNRIRLRLRHAGLRTVFLARRHRGLADARIRTARAPPLASLDCSHARDRAADPGLRARLLVRPLRLSQDPGALGVPQGPPFRRGDDDPDRVAPASGRDHRVHELDRARDRNRVWRHDLCLRSRRAARSPF